MSASSASATLPAGDPELVRTLRLGPGARARKRMWRGVMVAMAAAVVVAAALFWRARGAERPPAYVTAAVTRGELVVTVTATGKLEARNQVDVGSEVSGRVARVLVDDNAVVRRGQVLAELDPTTFDAQVAQARAQLAQAQAQLAQAEATRREALTTRRRSDGLFASGVISAQERDTATAGAERAAAAVALARATIAQARAALDVVTTNQARAVVRSPIDGVVLERAVEAGQTVVAAFQAPVLFRIAEDLKMMRVSVDIDEADVGLVRDGQTATFTVAAYLERQFPARVVAVHNAARLVDRVVSYEAVLDVDNRDLLLRPGMTVTAQVAVRRVADTLLVPSQALRFRPRGEAAPAAGVTRLWVLEQGRPRGLDVTVAAQNDTHAAITATGLAPGAAVITDVK